MDAGTYTIGLRTITDAKPRTSPGRPNVRGLSLSKGENIIV